MSKTKTYAKRAALAGCLFTMGIALFDDHAGSPFANTALELRLIGGILLATLFALCAAAVGAVFGFMAGLKNRQPRRGRPV